MSEGWERVAETVKRRRLLLGLSQREAARRADDISPTTWGNLEKHHQPVSDLSAASICKSLGWTGDCFAVILAGGEPTLSDTGPAPELRSTEDRLRALEIEMAEVRADLQRLLDAVDPPSL